MKAFHCKITRHSRKRFNSQTLYFLLYRHLVNVYGIMPLVSIYFRAEDAGLDSLKFSPVLLSKDRGVSYFSNLQEFGLKG